MGSTHPTVVLIDDDADVREAVGRLLRSAGWLTRTFASGREFQATPPDSGTGCVLLDISMPGITGLELHDWMRHEGISWPVIYLSAHCDVRSSVQAMKQGAIDVIEKPADADVLLQAVTAATVQHEARCQEQEARDDFHRRLRSLSPRERSVMDHVTTGRLNKQIAADLGIALKTVKVHRGRVMTKMQVRSVAALVHQCDQFGLDP